MAQKNATFCFLFSFLRLSVCFGAAHSLRSGRAIAQLAARSAHRRKRLGLPPAAALLQPLSRGAARLQNRKINLQLAQLLDLLLPVFYRGQ
ncbi:hypothetical protein SGRA_1631 [Saprospira grandis str. Lewin]|uniref:Uncharacterized protein n=1 Tax=Saprospira grandis (strain Lewin) TaxID=984262 RepID=H6LA03_SAPGL|nr:hypothetical protein SGRA_1631 [Saprospira grandis str. Lewin]